MHLLIIWNERLQRQMKLFFIVEFLPKQFCNIFESAHEAGEFVSWIAKLKITRPYCLGV